MMGLIVEALAAAGAAEPGFRSTTVAGKATRVGNPNLSGGQWANAFALGPRVLTLRQARRPALVLLDEPTGATGRARERPRSSTRLLAATAPVQPRS